MIYLHADFNKHGIERLRLWQTAGKAIEQSDTDPSGQSPHCPERVQPFDGDDCDRPGRSTRTAAKRVEALRKQGYGHVVDLDIRDFFGQVDRDILMELVGQVIKDRRVLGLIRGWLTAGVMEEGNLRYQISGTPQGGTISPLLSNVYLTVLDNALTGQDISLCAMQTMC